MSLADCLSTSAATLRIISRTCSMVCLPPGALVPAGGPAGFGFDAAAEAAAAAARSGFAAAAAGFAAAAAAAGVGVFPTTGAGFEAPAPAPAAPALSVAWISLSFFEISVSRASDMGDNSVGG